MGTQRSIPPWYDTDAWCAGLLLFALATVLFGASGIYIADAVKDFHRFIWFPGILTFMGGFLFIHVSVRLVRRRRSH